MARVVFVGELYNADLQVGGGPIYPGAPQPPLGIWGPPQMPPGIWPSPPGSRPPDPGYFPPGVGGPRPPSGPVDPGYSPPWAQAPVDPGWGVTPPVDPGWGVRPPVDPGYSPPWARPQPPQIAGGPGWLPPFAMPPIYLPPQAPVIDPVDPSKMHLVAYIPNADGTKVERITFTVDKPVSEPPTEATPKA